MPVSTQSAESMKEYRKKMDESIDSMHDAMSYLKDNSSNITDQNLHWLKDVTEKFLGSIKLELIERGQ